MTHEAPFETSGAPDGEMRYSHQRPTPTEAWQGYEQHESTYGTPVDTHNEQSNEKHDSSGSWRGDGDEPFASLLATTQEQLRKLKDQLLDLRLESVPVEKPMENGIKTMKDTFAMQEKINGEELKRWSALVGGGLLALTGLRRSLGSLTVMGVGAGLVYYALTGRSPLASLQLTNSGKQSQKRNHQNRQYASSTGSALDSSHPLITKSILVKAPLQKVYETWADFENFPQFMHHIQSVAKTGDDTSHWTMEGPFHTRLEWDARMTRDEENKRIAWSSFAGDIKTSGQVTFNSLPDGAVEVTVTLKYVPPAGLAGDLFARLLTDPEGKLEDDLQHFKRYMEAEQTDARSQNGQPSATESNNNGSPKKGKTVTN